MEEVKDGIKVGERLTEALRFADDKAMLAGSQKGLHKMMDRLNKISKEYYMNINIKKTKIMRISKGKEVTVKVSIDGKELQHFMLPRKYDQKLCKMSCRNKEMNS